MKELSIEEKAKAYDEALERAKEIMECSKNSDSREVRMVLSFFPELKKNEEDEDEKIRKEMIEQLERTAKEFPMSDVGLKADSWIAYLEKQGEHAKFRDSIQVGDKVTRNEDGVLVNLSQLKRVAKKDEKQGDDKVEQKPAEWSEEDETCMTNIIIMLKEGASLHFNKKDITKAVDATVHIDAGGYPYIPQMELYDYDKDEPLAKEGDKYKVILIKEG